MKTQRKTPGDKLWNSVGMYQPGDVIEMKVPVNQFCQKEDFYVIGDIPSCYLRDARPERTSWVLQDKTPVVNLRTGGISMVQAERLCVGKSRAVLCPDGAW